MSPLEFCIEAAIVILVTVILVFGVASANARKQCLAAGWPKAEVDYMLNTYCIKRVDQTDVVVPLKELRE